MSYEDYLINLWAWRGVVEHYGSVVPRESLFDVDKVYSVIDDCVPDRDAVDLSSCSLADYAHTYSGTLEGLVVALVNAYRDRDEIDRLCLYRNHVYSLQAGCWKRVFLGASQEAIQQVSLSGDKNAWFNVGEWSTIVQPVAH